MKFKGINATTIKWIAVITMFIDHFAFVVLSRMEVAMGGNEELLNFAHIFRGVGRLAFPLFCFLLVEGFTKTGNALKYLGRMGLFALISEVPFDLAVSLQPFDMGYQSTMVTLFVALLTMYGVDYFMNSPIAYALKYSGMALCVIGGMYLVDYLRADYGSKAIFCIMVLYLLRNNRLWQALGGAVSFIWERIAPFAFLFVFLYNGEKGKGHKYFFYIFYPAHLLVLYLICVVLGYA